MHKPPADDGEPVVIPLVEETLRVEKREVVRERVRVVTRTERTEQIVREALSIDQADVERVTMNREIAAGEPAPTLRHEPDGTIVIPVLEEVLVVETRLVLREEIRVRITSAQEAIELPVTLRRQSVVMERLPGQPAASFDETGETS